MAKKKHPRFSRLRTRPKRIRKSRRSKNKKPPQIPAFVSSIVTYKNSGDNLFNIKNKCLGKNTNNSKLIVQKRDEKTYYIRHKNSIIYITRILKKVSKTTKTLESLVNDLRPEFSFGSVINSLSSSSRFISYTQPTTYSGKTKTENNSSDYLWTTLNFEEDYNSGDDQQSEVEEGTSEKNLVTQENDSLYRHILELLFPYSPEQKQTSKDDLWDTEGPKLSRYTDSLKHEIFDFTKPYGRLHSDVISHLPESFCAEVFNQYLLPFYFV